MKKPHHKLKGSTSSGKISTFGGPADIGVSPSEGLAFIQPDEVETPYCRELLLPEQPPGTTGLARRLNPQTFYCAMRVPKGYGYAATQRALVIVRANGRACYVRVADWGPAAWTGRIIDLSPGAADWLKLKTDDVAAVTTPWGVTLTARYLSRRARVTRK